MKDLRENSKVTDNTTIFYDMLTREGARPEERTEDHLTTEAVPTLSRTLMYIAL